MAKKALLVGIGKYSPVGQELVAPVNEMNAWATLLSRHYGFANTDITRLPDEDADHRSILAEFRSLVHKTRSDDQLVFYFGGHGTVAFNSTTNELEEAIVAYPAEGDLRKASITDSEIAQIVREENVPIGTDLTFIIDACCSGGFFKILGLDGGDELPPEGAKLLFIGPSKSILNKLDNLKRPPRLPQFGVLKMLKDAGVEQPIVLAACQQFREGFELSIDGRERLLFSARALQRLETNAVALEQAGQKPEERGDTFDSLLDAIRQLQVDIPQTPSLHGNLARRSEVFPGQAQSQVLQTPPPPQPPEQFSNAAVTASTERSTTVNSIDVTFKGICCFVDARNGNDPFTKRVVMPYDNLFSGNHHHITFLEVAEDHIDSISGVEPKVKTSHDGGGVPFWRWELSGHSVAFLTADTKPPLDVTPSYDYHVPQMYNLVSSDLEKNPRDECFSLQPPPDVIAGFVDLKWGTLTAGPLEKASTFFENKAGDHSPWGLRRTPLFAVHQLPLSAPSAVIHLARYANLPPYDTVIRLKAGASVTIGNAMEADILEAGSGNNPSDHFLLYYKLARPGTGPTDPPLPKSTTVPINACSVTNWP
jgi:hypothetical protein